MGAPKYKSSQLKKLFPEKNEQNFHDKRIIETLKQRLNEMIAQDENTCKKAASVLESWLRQKPKK